MFQEFYSVSLVNGYKNTQGLIDWVLTWRLRLLVGREWENCRNIRCNNFFIATSQARVTTPYEKLLAA